MDKDKLVELVLNRRAVATGVPHAAQRDIHGFWHIAAALRSHAPK